MLGDEFKLEQKGFGGAGGKGGKGKKGAGALIMRSLLDSTNGYSQTNFQSHPRLWKFFLSTYAEHKCSRRRCPSLQYSGDDYGSLNRNSRSQL